MADHNSRYHGTSRQHAVSLPSETGKRPRMDFEMSGGDHVSSYHARDNEKADYGAIRDTDSVNALYELYLRNEPISSYGADTGRSIGGLEGLHEINDLRVLGMGGSNPAVAVGGQPQIALPPDASSTLFVEGLPADCTRREASHIFRPFVGYKEVRLANKGPRHPGGDPLVLCFVDFQSPAHAATVKDALQGYIFDEQDRDSSHLRLQFARNPGARSGRNFGRH